MSVLFVSLRFSFPFMDKLLPANLFEVGQVVRRDFQKYAEGDLVVIEPEHLSHSRYPVPRDFGMTVLQSIGEAAARFGDDFEVALDRQPIPSGVADLGIRRREWAARAASS